MSLEALLLVGVILLLLAVLLLLLTRKPASDPTLPLLQAAQERQATALATVKEALSGDIARQKTELSLELSGFTTEQTRALNAAILKQTESLAAMEKALLERLSIGAQSTQEATAGQNQALSAAMLKQTEALAAMEKALLERLTADAKSTQEAMSAETARSREVLDKKLTEMRETSEKRLTEIQKSVNEQLAGAVEKQMNESFARVIDQFTAVQKAMGEVQAVTAQIGDIKRLFGNIKTRGGWGEAQLKQMLEDFLPAGAYETNVRLREGSLDAVEFCIRMPGGEERTLLPVDAKFPSEDYERLLLAHEAGDAVEEARARKALEARVRAEAAKIAEKYICPPRTTDYALMFLPTEGLYAEIARMPGMIDNLARQHRIYLAGPFMLPVMLKNIQLGYVQYALSRNAEGVQRLLSATKGEMAKMDKVFESLSKNVGTLSNTIGRARTRSSVIARTLREVELLPEAQAAELLQLDESADEDAEEPEN